VTTSEIARLIFIDFIVVVGITAIVGITAPRWPDRWLDSNRGPLRWFAPRRDGAFRTLRVTWLARTLPELGSTFGGTSKRELPGRDAASLQRYLIEVRRAEWVHIASAFSFLALIPFNPWWLTVLFGVITLFGNAPFLLILRYNRLRLTRLLERMT
jgi:glycosyl-4,4'-diaponeurosporenoate acyltransferase